MSSDSRRRRIPAWAQRERTDDMIWIAENLHVFWPAAREQYHERGRGAIVVDTTQQPHANAGHPFGYITQTDVEETDDVDVKRMVEEYDPENEIVVVLMKDGGKQSTYRTMVSGLASG